MQLQEIQTAIDLLPREDKESLLHHLEMSLHQQAASERSSAEQWMRRLDELRASIGTGSIKLTVEDILADSREE